MMSLRLHAHNLSLLLLRCTAAAAAGSASTDDEDDTIAHTSANIYAKYISNGR
jgi:hypothetical protein